MNYVNMLGNKQRAILRRSAPLQTRCEQGLRVATIGVLLKSMEPSRTIKISQMALGAIAPKMNETVFALCGRLVDHFLVSFRESEVM